MKRLQVLLVVLVGAAAAMPGIAITRQFQLPSGSTALFEFVLVTFSAGVVLTAYIARHAVARWSLRGVLIGASAGMLLVFMAFMLHLHVTNLLLVEHDFHETGTPERLFFPLYLSEEDEQLVQKLGGRRAVIETDGYGIATVYDMYTERNVAFSMGTMLATYTFLIGSVAALFSMLGFHALPHADDDDLAKNKKGDEKPSSGAP